MNTPCSHHARYELRFHSLFNPGRAKRPSESRGISRIAVGNHRANKGLIEVRALSERLRECCRGILPATNRGQQGGACYVARKDLRPTLSFA